MITGAMRNLEGVVALEVSGPGSKPLQVEALIDTGYNGYLTLPADDISAIRLPFAGHRRGRLADGSIVLLDMYQSDIIGTVGTETCLSLRRRAHHSLECRRSWGAGW
jgi:predicted aspartyl protease